MLLSERCRRLCDKLIITGTRDTTGVSSHRNDFGWLKPRIAEPARRYEFLRASSMSPDQAEAISLHACLELMQRNASDSDCGLADEQRKWLGVRLKRLCTLPKSRIYSSSSMYSSLHFGEIASRLAQELKSGLHADIFSESCSSDSVTICSQSPSDELTPLV